jgi:hypothetical protein
MHYFHNHFYVILSENVTYSSIASITYSYVKPINVEEVNYTAMYVKLEDMYIRMMGILRPISMK